MRIAVTGGLGEVGRALVDLARARGHRVVSIDRVAPPAAREEVAEIVGDTSDYPLLLRAFEKCDAVVHLAAIIKPFRDPDHVVHNSNVTGSYNVMRAAIACGITRICQASSVNATGLSYSRAPRFDYFPIDEAHPAYVEDPYSLSKWVCEQQADAFARRYDDLHIASLRYHWVVADRAQAAANFNRPGEEKHLWGYTLLDAAAEACLSAVERSPLGHERYSIVEAETTSDIPSRTLAARHFPEVPIRGAFAGTSSFFDSSKARNLLGLGSEGPA